MALKYISAGAVMTERLSGATQQTLSLVSFGFWLLKMGMSLLARSLFFVGLAWQPF